MEKLHGFCVNTYQQLPYGSQNNLNNRSQFLKSTCAIVKCLPNRDTLLRTTWNRWYIYTHRSDVMVRPSQVDKRLYHIWSRGRHFSISLPDESYRKLTSKSDHRVEISGSIVRYDAIWCNVQICYTHFTLLM